MQEQDDSHAHFFAPKKRSWLSGGMRQLKKKQPTPPPSLRGRPAGGVMLIQTYKYGQIDWNLMRGLESEMISGGIRIYKATRFFAVNDDGGLKSVILSPKGSPPFVIPTIPTVFPI
jgi:hypothetical protein